MLSCAETWSVTEVNRKRLEAFHHTCLRKTAKCYMEGQGEK